MKSHLLLLKKLKLTTVLLVSLCLPMIMLFQNCSEGAFEAAGSGVRDLASLADGSSPLAPVCRDGEQQTGYLVDSVAYPVLCGALISKTCQNGQWSRPETLYPNCRQQCLHPENNQAVDPGSTYISYSANQGANQAACDAARVTSTCDQASGTFMPAPAVNRTCLVQGQVCAYTTGAGRANPTGNMAGSTVMGFALQSATYPALCGAQVTRTCQANGQWSGTTPLYTSCTQRCLHPETNQPMDAGAAYVFYTRQTGTQAECDAARLSSTCQAATGLVSPAAPVIRYLTCAVISDGEARFRAAKAVLAANCTSCHSSSGGQRNFDLMTEQDFINAGLIVPAKIAESKIIIRLRNYPLATAEPRNMPPAGPLQNPDYLALTNWVSAMPAQAPPNPSSCVVGEQQTGYLMASVVYPARCGAQVTKTCQNGQWSRPETLYPNCRQQCLHPENNQAVDPGSTYISYSVNQGASQAVCDAARVTSTCEQSSGTFMPAPAENRSCLVQGQICAYAAGAGLANPTGNMTGATVSGFALQSATFPALCGAQVTRSCQANGQWTGTVPLYTSCTQRCVHPDTNQPMDAGTAYVFYTRQTGTQAECDAARHSSTCQAASGTLAPSIPNTRFPSCTVLNPVGSVFPRSFNFAFRREQPITMTMNALVPLPSNVSGEFTVLSIVSTDVFRIRKYLGGTFDVGTKIPITAVSGATSITLTLNHVPTAYLRTRATITLISQATPNVLPQEITITIEPKDSDVVDAADKIPGVAVTKTYDGKLITSRPTITNIATQGRGRLTQGIYPTFAQELADGRTYVTTVVAGDFFGVLRTGVYLSEKISFLSATNSYTVAAISEDKNYFYLGGATGQDSIPLNSVRYPSPVGPLKGIYSVQNVVMLLTESGKLYSVTATATNPARYSFSTPVELSFGAPVILGSESTEFGKLIFVTSNNRVIVQTASSPIPSTQVVDIGSEPGNIVSVKVDRVSSPATMYVQFSTGKHYTIVFDPITSRVISKIPCTFNPDLIVLSPEFNNTYYVVNPGTGVGSSVPSR